MNKEDDTGQRLENLEVGIRGVMAEIDKLAGQVERLEMGSKSIGVSLSTDAELLERHDAAIAELREDMSLLGRELQGQINVHCGAKPSEAHPAWLEDHGVVGPAPRDDAAQGDELGRIVREVWVAYAREHGDTKLSHLAPWDVLPEYDKEVDRRIGRAVANHVLITAPEGEDEGARGQIKKLANFIMENCPERITQGGAGDVAIDIIRNFLASDPEGENTRRRVIEELAVEAEGYFHAATYPSWLRAHLPPAADAEGFDEPAPKGERRRVIEELMGDATDAGLHLYICENDGALEDIDTTLYEWLEWRIMTREERRHHRHLTPTADAEGESS